MFDFELCLLHSHAAISPILTDTVMIIIIHNNNIFLDTTSLYHLYRYISVFGLVFLAFTITLSASSVKQITNKTYCRNVSDSFYANIYIYTYTYSGACTKYYCYYSLMSYDIIIYCHYYGYDTDMLNQCNAGQRCAAYTTIVKYLLTKTHPVNISISFTITMAIGYWFLSIAKLLLL